MRRPATVELMWLLIATLLSTGCGGGTPPDTPTVKKRAVSQLPAVTDYLPPLDDNRIEVPIPKNWNPVRKKGYLAVFQLTGRAGFPQIMVTAEDDPGPNTTEENVLEFVEQTQADLDKRVAEKKIIRLEPARAMMLGDNAYVRYVLAGRREGKELATLERQILQTVQRGRRYTIELVVSENLTDHRDYAYAIAAGMKFLDPGTKDAAAQPGPKPADENKDAAAKDAAAKDAAAKDAAAKDAAAKDAAAKDAAAKDAAAPK